MSVASENSRRAVQIRIAPGRFAPGREVLLPHVQNLWYVRVTRNEKGLAQGTGLDRHTPRLNRSPTARCADFASDTVVNTPGGPKQEPKPADGRRPIFSQTQNVQHLNTETFDVRGSPGQRQILPTLPAFSTGIRVRKSLRQCRTFPERRGRKNEYTKKPLKTRSLLRPWRERRPLHSRNGPLGRRCRNATIAPSRIAPSSPVRQWRTLSREQPYHEGRDQKFCASGWGLPSVLSTQPKNSAPREKDGASRPPR